MTMRAVDLLHFYQTGGSGCRCPKSRHGWSGDLGSDDHRRRCLSDRWYGRDVVVTVATNVAARMVQWKSTNELGVVDRWSRRSGSPDPLVVAEALTCLSDCECR